MRNLSMTASPEEVKAVIRHWVALLAAEKYDEAVELLSPEVPPSSGSISHEEAEVWTPELLRSIISNYGLPEPWEGQEQTYRVVPLDNSLHDLFEKYLRVEFREFTDGGRHYLGGVHVDLPLNYESGNDVSDLTARFYFRQVNEKEMALVLLDIHMM